MRGKREAAEYRGRFEQGTVTRSTSGKPVGQDDSCLTSFILNPAGAISLSGREGSCPTSSILNPAGCRKLIGQGRLLPHKLYSQSGRGQEAYRAGKAPAPQPYFRFRQGLISMLPRDGSCLTSSILNPAGCRKLVGHGRLLPHSPISDSGRSQ